MSGFSIAPEIVTQFCRIIGDFNPLHHDIEFAAALGFSNVVVPGSLLATIMFGEVSAKGLSAQSTVRIKFHQWVLAEEPLELKWPAPTRLVLADTVGIERTTLRLA